jgi:predicted nucleotidyltransferase
MATYQVKVASLDDLIAMKRTTGRAKDVPKLAELLELRKLVQESE